MNKLIAVVALLVSLPAAAQREESISEMTARARAHCLQQPKEVQAECRKQTKAQIDLVRAQREADAAERRRQQAQSRR